MKVGWMWFDDDPKRTIEEKVSLAAQRYREKFGRAPNTCYVNQATLSQEETHYGPLHVIAVHNILPNYFWLGEAEAKSRRKRKQKVAARPGVTAGPPGSA